MNISFSRYPFCVDLGWVVLDKSSVVLGAIQIQRLNLLWPKMEPSLESRCLLLREELQWIDKILPHP